MHAGSFGVENSGIKQRGLAGGRSVDNHASEVAQATYALCGMLAAQHFEDCIHAFSVREFFDGIFIIALLVIDPMLQTECLHLFQLRVGG